MGYVYFFKHKNTKGVKIGMTQSDDVQQRFNSFNTYSPEGGEIIETIETFNAPALEKRIHKDYKKYKLNGEFYNISTDEVLDICDKYSILGNNHFNLLVINTPKFYNTNTRILAVEKNDLINQLFNYYDIGFTIEDRIHVESTMGTYESFLREVKHYFKDIYPIKNGLWFEGVKK